MSKDMRVIVNAVLMPAAKLDSCGNVELVAELRDGALVALTSFFSDEHHFDPSDFVGHTVEWSRESIRSAHDRAWGLRPEFSTDAGYDHAVKQAWEEQKMAAWQDGGSYDVEF